MSVPESIHKVGVTVFFCHDDNSSSSVGLDVHDCRPIDTSSFTTRFKNKNRHLTTNTAVGNSVSRIITGIGTVMGGLSPTRRREREKF